MKKYNTSRPKKSQAEKVRGDIFFFIIGCFIFYLFERIFSFILSPLQTPSRREVKERLMEKTIEKVKAREERLERISNTESDPMYQFSLRFVDQPEKYRDDPDNKVYKEWFEEWKKGNIIDSTLRWAPDIFNNSLDNINFEDYLNSPINPVFIKYMKIQWALHKKAPLKNRLQFSNTIYKFYPELSPNLKSLENNLAGYEAEYIEKDMVSELQGEIQKFGLPEDISEYLANKDLTPADLRRAAKLFKSHIENGLSSETCIYAYEHDLDKDQAVAINMIIKETGLPARVGYAFLKNDLTMEEVLELYSFMEYMSESYGSDLYSVPNGKNKTVYDDFIDTELARYKKEKRAKKYFK